MYIPHLPRTLLGTPTSPLIHTLTRRTESPPTSASNEGFWEVQFNFWGTVLAFIVAIAIITGILTWCLVCRGKRLQKKAARAKEKEERKQREIVGKVVGEDGVGVARNGSRLGVGRSATVRKSEISRPFTAQTGSGSSGSGFVSVDEKMEELELESEGTGYGYASHYGYPEDKKSWEAGIGNESPVPSYHSRSTDSDSVDLESRGWRGENLSGGVERERESKNGGAVSGGWHRVEVNGTVYMARERGDSANLEGREIKYV